MDIRSIHFLYNQNFEDLSDSFEYMELDITMPNKRIVSVLKILLNTLCFESNIRMNFYDV